MNASVRLIETVVPTSVHLHVSVPESHPSAQLLGTERTGSGTFIDQSGVLITVNYVVLGADSIEVTLVDGTTLPGETVAQDFYTGLAAVTVPAEALAAARTRSSESVALGDEVFILSSAGSTERRINSGAISGLGPFDAYWEYRLERSIRTTAMNPGFGGGGLFLPTGELIGVVSLELGEIGRFTLAVPVEYFLDHSKELLRDGRRTSRPRRAWIGMFCYELRENVVVGGILPGGPGEHGGLKPGDVILVVDGHRIRERQSLYQCLWEHQPGDLITFQVFRNRGVKELSVLAADAEVFFA
jgi:S1-C subfamily serine protease